MEFLKFLIINSKKNFKENLGEMENIENERSMSPNSLKSNKKIPNQSKIFNRDVVEVK